MNEATRFLIVNADDFGWSRRVNAAVLLAHTSGILTSASLMVAEASWQEAVAIALDTPSLGIGLHVATTFDRALLPAARIPALVGPSGKFEADPLRAGLRYAFSSRAGEQLAVEMEAQFERFQQTGLPWDHVDGHQHFHMHPTVFRHLLALCDRYGANRLRVPRESFVSHLKGGGDGLTPVAVGALVLQLLCRMNMRALRRKKTLGGRPIFVCDRVYGDFQSSNMHTDYTLRTFDRLEGRVAEIYFHPGSDYAVKLPVQEQTDAVRDVELAALIDSRVVERARRSGVQLLTYAEAEAAVEGAPGR